MLRVTLVLVLTMLGLFANMLDPFWGLILYTWYSYSFPLEMTWGNLEGTRLSFVVAVCFAISCIFYKKKLFTLNPLSILIIIFVIHVVLSLALVGEYSVSSVWNSTENLIKLAMISLIVPVLIINTEHFKYYILAIVLFSGFLAFYYGFFGLFAGSQFIIGAGKIGDNNSYAASLVGILPLGIACLRIKIHPLIKLGVLFAVLGFLLSIYLTFSRGGLIALFVVLTLLVLKIRKIFIIPLFVVFSLVYYFLDANNYVRGLNEYSFNREFRDNVVSETFDEYRMRMHTLLTSPEETESAQSRIHFWHVAYLIAKEHPFLGIGYGRYRDFYDEYDFSDGKYGLRRAVHSLFFSILSELGFFGLLLFLIIILKTIWNFLYLKKYLSSEKDIKKLVSYLPIALTGFLTASLFVNTLNQEILWSLLSLGIVLEYAKSRYQTEEN